MKNTIALVLLLAVASVMPAQTKKKSSVQPTTAVAKALVIPSAATANPDGTYSFTDKQGKHWIYNKTPFGISRTQDMGPAPVARTTDTDQFLTFTQNGDSYKFTRKTPFGQTAWEHKKTELTEEERRVVEARTTSGNPQ